MTYVYTNYSIYAWDLASVTSTGGTLFPDAENGKSSPAGATFTISGSASLTEVTVRDNDSYFNDGDTSQDATAPVSLDGTTISAGDIAPEYSYVVRPEGSTNPADNITVYAINMGDNVIGFVSTAPMQPGQTYTVLSLQSNCPSVPYSSLATTALPPLVTLDGIVEGTGGADLIDYNYTGDPDGDEIDHNDAILPGEAPQDDIVEAGAGDDTVYAGEGDDDVRAGAGDDLVYGQAGNDSLAGSGGEDTLDGGTGDDTILGGSDDDSLLGGSGNDVIWGDNAGASGATPGNVADPLTLSADNVQAGSQTGTDGCANAGDSVIYRNVTVTEDGRVVMAKLILVDRSSGLKVDLTGGEGKEILLNGDNDAGDAGKTASFRLEFFDQVTGLPIDISSIATFGDLDKTQFAEMVGIPASMFTNYGLTADTSLTLDAGSTITATGTEQNDPSDQDAWFSAAFEDRGFIEFTLTTREVNSGFTLNGAVIDQPVIVDLNPGNDTLAGGDGNDTLYGEAGDDLLTGGTGADSMSGGDDRDTFIVGAGADGADDVVDGGEGGDDYDVLDLTGAGPLNIIYDALNPENGTVQFLDGDGNVTGTLNFVNIERVITDQGDGIVEGTGDDDLIDLAYTGDPEGDMIDNSDALLPGEAPQDDIVTAGAGDDTVYAGLGDDDVYGEAGDDELHGEAGDDLLVGGSGSDTLLGGDDDDTLIGGDGNDRAEGGEGDDLIDTSGGGALPLPDLGYPGLFPADANPTNDLDTVYGGAGNDTIRTGDDADWIDGGTGNDVIDAGVDRDTVAGGSGDDFIVGGEGSDLIDGGTGNDTIYGGLDPSFPDNLNIPDSIDLVPDNGRDTITGGDGNDVIFGQDDDDVISGDAGNDYIDGGIDEDTITGGTGSDTVIGGEGADSMAGGADRDTFLVGTNTAGLGDFIDGNEEGDDFDTLNLTGAGPLRVIYDPLNPENGTVEFLDGVGGPVTGTLTFKNIENVIPCFTPGTLVATPRGEVAVEELRAGDRVITRDNGLQQIRWVGKRALNRVELAAAPHLRPVLIRAGSLGHGLPERDMLVSPNHRMLVANDRTALYFEEHEVLVAAKHLVDNKGIKPVEVLGTTYMHFMFDRHEVVLANGAWTESFQPGDQTLGGMGNAQRAEIFELFPDLKTPVGVDSYGAARRTLKKHEAALLGN